MVKITIPIIATDYSSVMAQYPYTVMPNMEQHLQFQPLAGCTQTIIVQVLK